MQIIKASILGAINISPTTIRDSANAARRQLDWWPRIDLETGLRRTIEYFRALLADDAAPI